MAERRYQAHDLNVRSILSWLRGRLEQTDPDVTSQVDRALAFEQDLRDRLYDSMARELRCAQALRLLRDTSTMGAYTYRVADRALREAGIPDPPDEDHP